MAKNIVIVVLVVLVIIGFASANAWIKVAGSVAQENEKLKEKKPE